MKKLCSLFIMGAIAFSFSFFQTGCGSGGGGGSTSRQGGPDASLTTSNAERVGDTVIQAVKLVAPATALGELKTSSISSEQSPPLVSILEHVLSASGDSVTAKHINGVSLYDKSCANGGNISANVSDADLVNKLIKGEVNANSCKIGTETLNGTMKVVYKLKNLSDVLNPTYDNLKNFEKVTITTSGFTYANTANSDNVTLNDFTLVLQNFTYSGNVLTGGSITMGGIAIGAIGGEAIDFECDSFGLLFKTDTTGVSVSVSGRIKASSCLGGWVTMVTNNSVFIPTNAHCPTAGDVVVSAGGNTVTMHVDADFRITIFFNSNVVRTFNSCSDVKGLCI